MLAFSLAPSSVLVTGSSQGIGHAIALAAHAAGASVIFHGKEAAAPAMPAGSLYLAGDLLDPSGPETLVRAAFAARPNLDLMVCNAGSFFDVPFREMTPVLFERTINLNVRANYFLAQAFAREMAARNRPGAMVLGWVAAFILLSYLVPHFLVSLLPSQDLKKKARRTACNAC